LGAAKFEQGVEVGRIRGVEQEAQKLDHIPVVVIQQVPPDVSQILQIWIPTGTGVQEQFQAPEIFNFFMAYLIAGEYVAMGTDANQLFQGLGGVPGRVVDLVPGYKRQTSLQQFGILQINYI